MILEYNSYRMAWGLLSIQEKRKIYEAMKELPGGELAAQIIIADMRELQVSAPAD